MLFQKQSYAIMMIAAFSFISSCKKGSDTPPTPAPVANFNYSGAGLAPATVSFSNASTNSTTYSWDFGDNGTSTQTSPSHTYTKGGVYTVKLTSTGNGGTNSTTKSVNISTPTSVKITSIKIIQMPFTTPNGATWDQLPSSGPDVYFTITGATDNVLYNHPTYLPDVTVANLPLTINLTTPFQITNFATTYKLKLWDYDASAPSDDSIGGYSFSLAGAAQSGYPTTVTLFTTGSNIKIDLQLQWQ